MRSRESYRLLVLVGVLGSRSPQPPFLSLVLLSILLMLSPFVTTAASGQIGGTSSSFADDTGFIVNLPVGWIANDYQNLGPDAQSMENTLGYTKLATFCDVNDSTPSLGSQVNTCDTDHGLGQWIQVFRYKDLASKPEFAPIIASGRAITANDVFLYHLEEIKRYKTIAYSDRPYLQGSSVDIYEGFTQENVPVEANGQSVVGKIVKLAYGYSLFFIDPSTGYAYRVTASGHDIGEWRDAADRFSRPEAIVSVLDSVGVNLNAANSSNPLFTYVPPTTADARDPGAIVVATPPPPAASSSSPMQDLNDMRIFGPLSPDPTN